MEPFLSRSAFVDDARELPGAGSPLAGQTRFNGLVVFANWPRGDMAAVLPADLELAANTVAPARHPMAFIIGEQTRGALTFGGFIMPTGIGYHEIGITVPFVRHGRDRRLHTYIPRMYSSYFPAVWTGNMHYGFGKQMGHMQREGAAVLLRGDDDRPRLRVEVAATGGWVPGDHCRVANFEAMRAIFTMPVVGRRADGRYVCSRFDWGFGEALVREAEVHLVIEALLGPGLTPRHCPVVPGGAFELRGMLWRLSWPAPCPA
jgi:hypothetical protein